ncbi:MAG TPA: segregation/condensation protein A, partial [Firmicutes bacterium]|nr:segregation/condensation protein A [Bacillota bacterium]
MGYAVRLQVFEGPLDLLLHLVEANRVDIYDIPVAEITAQYLRYLQDMAAVDLEAGAEFVVMAATLLEIKARMLLPVPAATEPKEPDPRRELVERLVRYRQFKRAAGYLQGLAQAQAQRFLRGGKVAAGDPMSAPVAPERLARALWAL